MPSGNQANNSTSNSSNNSNANSNNQINSSSSTSATTSSKVADKPSQTSSSSIGFFHWSFFNSSKTAKNDSKQVSEDESAAQINSAAGLTIASALSVAVTTPSTNAPVATSRTTNSHSNGTGQHHNGAVGSTLVDGNCSTHILSAPIPTSSAGGYQTNGNRLMMSTENCRLNTCAIRFEEIESRPESYLQLTQDTLNLISSITFVHARMKVIRDLNEQLSSLLVKSSDVHLLVQTTLDAFQISSDELPELGTDATVHPFPVGSNGSAEDALFSVPLSPPLVASVLPSELGIEQQSSIFVDSADENGKDSDDRGLLGEDTQAPEETAPTEFASVEISTLRVDILKMYTRLTEKHFDQLSDVIRRIFFLVVKECAIGKLLSHTPLLGDFREQLRKASLQLLITLTNNGKQVSMFRVDIDELLLRWLQQLSNESDSSSTKAEHVGNLMSLTRDVIRYNASAFSQSSLAGIICCGAQLFNQYYQPNGKSCVCTLCLDMFDILLRYSYLPTEKMEPYTETLCRGAYNSDLKPEAWKIMKNLLSNDLGYSLIHRLTNIVQKPYTQPIAVVCGAIYCLAQAFWTSESSFKNVRKNQCSFIPMIFCNVLDLKSSEIALQIAEAMRLLLILQNERLMNRPIEETKIHKLEELDYIELSITFRDRAWEILLKLADHYESLLGTCVQQQLPSDQEAADANCAEQLIQQLNSLANLSEMISKREPYQSDTELFRFLERFTTIQIKEFHYNDKLPDHLVRRINLLIDKYEIKIKLELDNWRAHVLRLMELFYFYNSDTTSRIKVLKIFQRQCKLYRNPDDEEYLIDKVLLPQLKEAENEVDYCVREQLLKMIISLVRESSNSSVCVKLLEVLNRLMKHPLLRSAEQATIDQSVDVAKDSTPIKEDLNELIIGGLRVIFEEKIYEKNSLPAIEAYKMLASFASGYYCDGPLREQVSIELQKKILQFLLSIRTDFEGYIGLQKEDRTIKYSQHLQCKRVHTNLSRSPSISQLSNSSLNITMSNLASASTNAPGTGGSTPTPPVSSTASNGSHTLSFSGSSIQAAFSFEDLFNYLHYLLGKERDWTLLRIVLENLPELLMNQNIIHSTNYGQVINCILKSCFMLFKDSTTGKASNTSSGTNSTAIKPQTLASTTELPSYIFRIFTSLTAYREMIAPADQNAIIGSICFGLKYQQCTQQCIISMTICVIELPDAMAKNLATILSTLAKTSPKPQLAIPKLEFLSVLNLWPTLYSSFVTEQFMSIFAIIMPYTNPLKFNEYCVAQAHRVAASWYLNSRPSFRKNLADYIMRQLNDNIKMLRSSAVLKDSNNSGFVDEYRKRSSSLNTDNEYKRDSRANTTNSSTNVPSGRISSDSSQTTNSNNVNNNNVNLHSSPSLPSPALHGQQNVFTFNLPHDKSPVPASPSGHRQLQSHSLSVGANNASSTTITPTNLVNVQLSLNDQQHIHLVEVFIDLLSRYVAGGCSSLHSKDPLTSFLFEGGNSSTWLLGHKLITITTTACSAKAVKGDLCEKCYNMLHVSEEKQKTSTNNAVIIVNAEEDVFNESTPSNCSTVTDRTVSTANTSEKPTHTLFSGNSSSTGLHFQQSIGSNTSFLSSRRRHQSAITPAATFVQRRPTSRDDSHLADSAYTLYGTCSSWCPGWAEVLIRAPTGNSCWVMKLQNSVNISSNYQNSMGLIPLGLHNFDLLPQYSIDLLALSAQDTGTINTDNVPANSTVGESSSRNSLNTRLSQISESNVNLQPSIRGRSNTISFMNSDLANKRNELRFSGTAGKWSLKRPNPEFDLKASSKLHPNFLFLQFFHQGTFGCVQETPILLPKSDAFDNSMRVFDRITPYETHKIGIVYVGCGQERDRIAIFRNESGSNRYMQLLQRIGIFVRLDEIDPQKTFIGGLSQDGSDGRYACIHHEHLMQVIFHVATLMPNKESDQNCNDKNRHIGNNHVCIAYNDSKQPFNFSIVKGEGQWLKACIVITPLENDINLVHIQTIPELKELIFYSSPVMISDHNMPLFVRQLSLSANLMSLVYHSKKQNSSLSPFLSNWVERIRQIKHIKEKVMQYNTMTQSMKPLPNTNNHSSNEDISTLSSISINDNGSPYQFPDNFTTYI